MCYLLQQENIPKLHVLVSNFKCWQALIATCVDKQTGRLQGPEKIKAVQSTKQ